MKIFSNYVKALSLCGLLVSAATLTTASKYNNIYSSDKKESQLYSLNKDTISASNGLINFADYLKYTINKKVETQKDIFRQNAEITGILNGISDKNKIEEIADSIKNKQYNSLKQLILF